jgi:hypothetical protein
MYEVGYYRWARKEDRLSAPITVNFPETVTIAAPPLQDPAPERTPPPSSPPHDYMGNGSDDDGPDESFEGETKQQARERETRNAKREKKRKNRQTQYENEHKYDAAKRPGRIPDTIGVVRVNDHYERNNRVVHGRNFWDIFGSFSVTFFDHF